jgi:sugar lactone lactonase YvrE
VLGPEGKLFDRKENMMKKCFIFSGILLLLFSCTDSKNPISFTTDFIHEFSTESRPNAIVIDIEKGLLYISHSRPSKSMDIQIVQKYDVSGDLLGTFIDFTKIEDGNFSYYIPIDLTIDISHNLYVLVKPYQKDSDSTWFASNGFCIMRYNVDGILEREYDFSEYDEEWFPSACTYNNGNIYITNGIQIKKLDTITGQSIDYTIPLQDAPITLDRLHTTDIKIDNNNNFWLVGQFSFDVRFIGCHISKLNPSFERLESFYSKGKTDIYGANLNSPGIALDNEGNIYLATFYCKSVEIYDSHENLLTQIEMADLNESTALPISVALGDNKSLYVLDHGREYVCVYKVKEVGA